MKFELKENDIEFAISYFTMFIGMIMLGSLSLTTYTVITKLILAFSIVVPITLCGLLLFLRVTREVHYEEFKKEQEGVIKK